jgi:uncharacterized protein YlxW (UPF0749 family)
MPRFNKYTKEIIFRALIIAAFMLFGMLATNQYSLYKRLGFMESISDPNGQALRISQIYFSNEELKKQLTDLEATKSELDNSAVNSSDLERILQTDKQKYSILSGKGKVQGEGIRIEITHTLAKTQLIDFINALKNIGAEAISINEVRLINGTPISQFENQPKYEMKVIGNKDTLYDATVRNGGAFDLIVNGSAQKMDNLILPEAK